MARGVIVTICVSLGFVLTAAAVSPVSLKLYGGKNNWIHVNFYEDDFLKFSACMWTSNSLSCAADLTRDLKHPNETDTLRILSVNKSEILRTTRLHSNVFACNVSLSEKQLVCQRQLADHNLCVAHVEINYFHFLNESTQKSRCVGLRFSFSNESLLYDSVSDGIEICNISCNATIGNQRSSTFSHHTLPSNQQVSKASTDSILWNNTKDTQTHYTKEQLHHHDDDDHDDDDHHHHDYDHHDGDKTHIIIAAVVSMVVTSGLIVSAFLFRRQTLRMRRQQGTGTEYVSRTSTTEYTHNQTNDRQRKISSAYDHSSASIAHSLSTI